MKILISVAIFFLTFFVYRNTFHQFFLQDEWQGFGLVSYYQKIHSLLTVYLPYQGILSHFTPLARALFILKFKLFGLAYSWHAGVSVLTHAFNAILLFLLTYRTTKKFHIAIPTSMLFVVSSISHQAITWVDGGNGLLQAATLLLLSIFLLVRYTETQKKKYIYLSLLVFFISLFLKEDVVFYFLGLPIFFVILSGGKQKHVKTVSSSLAVVFVCYIGIRLFLVSNGLFAYREVVDVTPPSMLVYPLRIITMPLHVFTQSFFSENFILNASRTITAISYPQFAIRGEVNPYVSESVVADLIIYVLSLFILFLVFLCRHFIRPIHLFSLTIIFLSGLSYILIPGRAGYVSILPSRYLYIASVGASIFFVAFLFEVFYKRNKSIYFLSIAALLLFHYTSLQNKIETLVSIGALRTTFLNSIKEKYPILPKQVIFYTISDTPFYGSPVDEKTLPVQSGFGQMMLVWYDKIEQFPACLFSELFLYERLSQGYRECDGRGFGYFREKSKLVEAISKYSISPESVIGFSYTDRTKTFTDITDTLRKEIR